MLCVGVTPQHKRSTSLPLARSLCSALACPPDLAWRESVVVVGVLSLCCREGAHPQRTMMPGASTLSSLAPWLMVSWKGPSTVPFRHRAVAVAPLPPHSCERLSRAWRWCGTVVSSTRYGITTIQSPLASGRAEEEEGNRGEGSGKDPAPLSALSLSLWQHIQSSTAEGSSKGTVRGSGLAGCRSIPVGPCHRLPHGVHTVHRSRSSLTQQRQHRATAPRHPCGRGTRLRRASWLD